jgi:hypothetical protein
MTTFKTHFYLQSEDILEFPVAEKVFGRLETVGPSIARLYFVQDNAEIDIPDGIQVYDETNAVWVKKLCNTQDFVLGWTDNYSVRYQGKTIMNLINKRVWSVKGEPKTPFHLLE